MTSSGPRLHALSAALLFSLGSAACDGNASSGNDGAVPAGFDVPPVVQGADAAEMRDRGGLPVWDAADAPDAADTPDATDTPDAGDTPDAADTPDADPADLGPLDVGAPGDAGARDGGPPDVGHADASAADAGFAADAGLSDAGQAPGDAAPSIYVRPVVGTGAPLAALGTNGRLAYQRYANQGQQNAAHILPDYSHAGYGGGGVAIPTAPVQQTVSPGPGDDRARIQAAIDLVSQRAPDSAGLRGAVLLTRGTYQVSDTLRITASGVVIRGEGQGANGTVLLATRRAQHNLLEIRGSSSGFGEVPGSRVAITTPTVAVGMNQFDVQTPHTFAVGDTVVVRRAPNQRWIDTLAMGRYGWTASSYAIGHERTVVQVSGATVWVDIPLVDAIEAQYGGGSVFEANITGRLERCGVEDLRIDSEYNGDQDEDHGWTGVLLARATHSWVRRVTVRHFGFAAVNITSESNFNTVEDTAMIDPISRITGSRRYPFVVTDGVGNLFQRCYSRDGRHNFATGSRVTGPNVWLDCLAERSNSDDGPHHRWATGLLFDNTTGGPLNVQNRRTSGTGHGWAGAQTLFWNATATSIICDAPPAAMNWTIGSSGTRRQGSWPPAEPNCWTESHGQPVTPRSLYLQQLEDRRGAAAVDAVTLPAQRVSGITPYLSDWAGEGRLDELLRPDPTCARGVRAGQFCCASSCGTCGGTGCSQRPGGVNACCTSAIRNAGRSCTYFPPPCNLP